MSILHRYIFREILSSSVLGAVLATFVIFLQGIDWLFELIVKSSLPPKTVAYLFALAISPVLPFSLPFGVLVGILVGLGRMSADGEITAMRAAGVSSRKVVVPVLAFAVFATSVTAVASIYLTPFAVRERFRIANKLAAAELTSDIQPRVFQEQFPNRVLYVGEVRRSTGPVSVWENVFMADLTPPEQRNDGLKDRGDGPRITVAREAIAVADAAQNRIQLSFRDASSHEIGKDSVGYHSTFPRGDQALAARPPVERHARAFREMGTRELIPHTRALESGKGGGTEARIELHQRLALPLACLMLAFVGIPLGASSRKGGKSAGYVMGIFLAFFCYYLAFMSLTGLARQGKLPVEVAAWLPNAVFAIIGLILLARLEIPGDRDLVGFIRAFAGGTYARLKARFSHATPVLGVGRRPFGALSFFPQIIDAYVLSRFLSYFLLLLTAFVLMTEVFTFFDLLSDIIRNKIALSRVFTYLFFLTPKLIYDTAPISVLVAVLVTFGVLTKHNEVIAFKASGVSLYRITLPVLLVSVLFSAGLFAFDHFYVPEANRKQDAIRDEIKGRPVQTYLRPDRKWIFGTRSRIYFYRHFDIEQNVMVGVSVYELEPRTFHLRRHISAERAYWRPTMKTWVFENGWTRDIIGISEKNFRNFQVDTFPELDEPPDYFLKELVQAKQMNYRQLETYIEDLARSGFDTVRLRVQYHKKFSVPLFALIMAMLSVPFGFLVGNRGAMAGIGVSLGVAIAYWGVNHLFEQIGNVNQLPPALAAWSPDALFSLAGLYMFLRMRT